MLIAINILLLKKLLAFFIFCNDIYPKFLKVTLYNFSNIYNNILIKEGNIPTNEIIDTIMLTIKTFVDTVEGIKTIAMKLPINIIMLNTIIILCCFTFSYFTTFVLNSLIDTFIVFLIELIETTTDIIKVKINAYKKSLKLILKIVDFKYSGFSKFPTT